jgi:ppGpp synthetase/RelA/SpoT-type nucleotidyltranferase
VGCADAGGGKDRLIFLYSDCDRVSGTSSCEKRANTEMNLQEYQQKRELYGQFAETVRKILSAAIEGSSYKYHLQQIQCRAKTVESLEARLSEQGRKDAQNIEEIRNDLAGCRIIFYYNDDVNAFLSSGLVRDNFKVHWEKSKVHSLRDEAVSANDYYTANHFIVELDDVRASLSEYALFKGMKCEIQIHTVLNHAWAETVHDITYKKPETSGFGSRVLEDIDKRLQIIMKDYLRPAGYEFQKVQHDYRRFLEGKVLFDRNMKQEIIACQDNLTFPLDALG